jgi:hypothetical protein
MRPIEEIAVKLAELNMHPTMAKGRFSSEMQHIEFRFDTPNQPRVQFRSHNEARKFVYETFGIIFTPKTMLLLQGKYLRFSPRILPKELYQFLKVLAELNPHK